MRWLRENAHAASPRGRTARREWSEFWGWGGETMLRRRGCETRINSILWMPLSHSPCTVTSLRSGLQDQMEGLEEVLVWEAHICFGNFYMLSPAHLAFGWLWMWLVHAGDYPESDLISCFVIKLCFIFFYPRRKIYLKIVHRCQRWTFFLN